MARDPIGVKPFFFTRKDNRFIFASEIKTLLAHPQVEPVLGLTGLCELFFTGPGRTPGCGVLEGIEELKPGEYATLSAEGDFTRHTYWHLTDKQHLEDFEETAQKVRFLVTNAIERQLVSDVPIGTFLSLLAKNVVCVDLRKDVDPLETWIEKYQPDAVVMAYSLQMLGGENYAFN